MFRGSPLGLISAFSFPNFSFPHSPSFNVGCSMFDVRCFTFQFLSVSIRVHPWLKNSCVSWLKKFFASRHLRVFALDSGCLASFPLPVVHSMLNVECSSPSSSSIFECFVSFVVHLSVLFLLSHFPISAFHIPLHSMLDVRCWMFDVSHFSFYPCPSVVEKFVCFVCFVVHLSVLFLLSHCPISTFRLPLHSMLDVRCSMFDVSHFSFYPCPSVSIRG